MRICGEILDIKQVGVKTHFFELGINSISMVQIVNRINKELKTDLSYRGFMKLNNIAELASVVAPNIDQIEQTVYLRRFRMENTHLSFPLTEVQLAYLMGRDAAFEMAGSRPTDMRRSNEAGYRQVEPGAPKIINRHPMLRTVILPNGEQQILREVPEYIIKIEDIRHLDQAAQNKHILQERERMSHYVFNPEEWPLIELKAFRTTEDTHYLFMGYDC